MTGDPLADQLLKWLLNPNGISSLGLLGLMVVALLRGWVVPKWVHDPVVKERDTLRARSDAALEAYQKRDEVERLAQTRAHRAHREEVG